jgi:O-antigen/teichoic acid export membrane protein
MTIRTSGLLRKTKIFRVKRKEATKTPLKKYVIISFASSFLGLILSLFSQRFLPPAVPLFYGLPEGEEALVKSIYLILPSVFGVIITLTNLLIAKFTHNNYLKSVLVLSSLISSILATITTFKIILLVGNI